LEVVDLTHHDEDEDVKVTKRRALTLEQDLIDLTHQQGGRVTAPADASQLRQQASSSDDRAAEYIDLTAEVPWRPSADYMGAHTGLVNKVLELERAWVLHVSETRSARLPICEGLPSSLHPVLQDVCLVSLGKATLYSHQAEALAAFQNGLHVLLTTPTGSGKSLAMQLPVFDLLLREEPSSPDAATVLCFYPLRALALDQERKFATFAQHTVKNGGPAISVRRFMDKDSVAAVFGDIIPQLLLCTPDKLVHALKGIKTCSNLAAFFRCIPSSAVPTN
jgi:hypothetical protein